MLLFETEAEYRAEIAEVRQFLKDGIAKKSYQYTSGGPGSGAHEGWLRDPQAAMEYLKMLREELTQLLAQQTGGACNRVKFQRPV